MVGIPPPQRVSYSYQRMKPKCFSSALCLDLICTDNVIKIHQMSALVRSNASHFRAPGDPSDLVYAVLLLYIGPALNSPWRRAYQEQTHISPSAPKCICGRWVSTKTSICALTYKYAESAFVGEEGTGSSILGFCLRVGR